MNLSIGGHNGPKLAEIRKITAHGNPGCGCYLLYLQMEASVLKLTSNAEITELVSRIELQDPRISIAYGTLDGGPRISFGEYTDHIHIGFHYYLSGSQISAVEKARGTGDLNLSIWLYGATHYSGKTSTFTSQESLKILKQEWLEALDKMGYKKTLLFELPMPSENYNPDKDILEILQRAQNHILNGAYQESAGLCRQAIEIIEKQRDDQDKSRDAVNKYRSLERKDMSVDERMLLLREILKNITHLGNHPEDSFSRYQAQSILGMTVALLSSPEVGAQQ